MPSHYVQGCNRIINYARNNNVNVDAQRLCAALGIPVIHARQNLETFKRRVSEPESEAVANLLGLSMADCRTETGMQTAP